MAQAKRHKITQFFYIKGPSVLTMGIISYLFYVYNFRFLPNLADQIHITLVILIGLFMNINVVMVIWSYVRILTTAPGYTTEELKLVKSEVYNRAFYYFRTKKPLHEPKQHSTTTAKTNQDNYRAIEEIKEVKEDEVQKLIPTENTDKVWPNEESGYRPPIRSEREQPKRRSHPNATFRYCEKCDNIKPPRAHHCSVCQR